MRALLVGDIHLSDTPPSIRTASYADDILAKLTYAVDLANTHADVLVLLGDVFHIKTPSRTSHRLVQRTADVLDSFGGRVLIVPGNHDLSQDRIESLDSQPLGTLALSRNVEILMGYDDETGIFGIPYLSDWTTLPEWLDQAEHATLIATHAPIFPAGQTPPYDHILAPEWADQMTGPAPVAYGHIHDRHGFYQAHDVWFCNNGAISRGSLHEETLKRRPCVTLFDSDTPAGECPFASYDVPHRPAEDVFRLADKAADDDRTERLDAFLADLSDINLSVLNLEQVVADASKTDLSAAARAELADIIESSAMDS